MKKINKNNDYNNKIIFMCNNNFRAVAHTLFFITASSTLLMFLIILYVPVYVFVIIARPYVH